ncbi:hypothetical protein DsansV1_C08g0078781 [Dioscorea sansibarensis]
MTTNLNIKTCGCKGHPLIFSYTVTCQDTIHLFFFPIIKTRASLHLIHARCLLCHLKFQSELEVQICS